jgi:hypothetical protein
MTARWLAEVTIATIAFATCACGTDAVGVQACRQIQEARCRQAPQCSIALQPPYHSNGTDVDACIRFYEDACLHGLASGNDPGPVAVNACVAAINDGGCSVVTTPESATACSWLAPNAAADAANAAADAASAASDAASE